MAMTKEQKNEKRRAYYRDNKEKIQGYQKRYRAKDPEARRGADRDYHTRHPDSQREANRRYRQKLHDRGQEIYAYNDRLKSAAIADGDPGYWMLSADGKFIWLRL